MTRELGTPNGSVAPGSGTTHVGSNAGSPPHDLPPRESSRRAAGSSNAALRFFRFLLQLIFTVLSWLAPIKVRYEEGQMILCYTCFPKAFYWWISWLPGFVILALNGWGYLPNNSVVWFMFGFVLLTWVVGAEDLEWKDFLWIGSLVTLVIVLYHFRCLNWSGLPWVIGKLKQLEFLQDPGTLTAINSLIFAGWVIIYFFARVFKRRELSYSRHEALRPFFQAKFHQTLGLNLTNDLRDLLEVIFGGAYDILITDNAGHPMIRDRNVVGLLFFLRAFGHIVREMGRLTSGANSGASPSGDEGTTAATAHM